MEDGVTYNIRKLHQPGSFNELLVTNKEVSKTLRPLMRDRALNARLERLMTTPAVGLVTALTWH